MAQKPVELWLSQPGTQNSPKGRRWTRSSPVCTLCWHALAQCSLLLCFAIFYFILCPLYLTSGLQGSGLYISLD